MVRAKKQTKKKSAPLRPSWDDYFIDIMKMVGARSTCDRGRSGCVIVRDKRILSTGYVGAPRKAKHCDDVGHELHTIIHPDGSKTQHCIRTAHAEQNALAQAAREGVRLDGATLYCQMTPCYVCAKMIVNAGILQVVAYKDYHVSRETKLLFKAVKINFTVLSKDVEEYANMKA